MKPSRLDLNDPTTELGYNANITKQEYTHVLSNYYTAPKISLSQMQKKKLFFSTDITQTEIPEHVEPTFSYSVIHHTVYSGTTHIYMQFR